jgi:protein gp37
VNKTSIAWIRNPDGSQGYTWNCITGCKAISPGCAHCYAARLAGTRLAHLPQYAGLTSNGHWTGEVRFLAEKLAEPLARKKPCSIFVCDMADLFHEAVTNEQIAAVFGVMAACPQHTFHVLTKRAKRMREWFEWIAKQDGRPALHAAWCLLSAERDSVGDGGPIHCKYGPNPDAAWPLPNIRVGVTVENQQAADRDIAELLRTPAAVRFLSMEPLLEPAGNLDCYVGKYCPGHHNGRSEPDMEDVGACEPGCQRGIDWVIVGCESGPRARPFHVEWARSIIQQCREAGTACFVKQIAVEGRLVKDVEGFPSELRVRETPAVRT